MNNIEVVRSWDNGINDIDSFLEETRNIRDMEGFVIRFNDGNMLKVKADHYVQLHRTKDMMYFEKDVLALIVGEKIDDNKPYMDDESLTAINNYEIALHKAISDTAERLKWIVIAGKDNYNSKKDFAVKVVALHPQSNERSLLFSIWEKGEENAFGIVKDYILKNVGTQARVDEIRNLIGNVYWRQFYLSNSQDDEGE